MSDVRLTATNPVDSSVVPVACNEKGELKLEEPQVSSDLYVEKTGDTMTGNLHLGDGITLNPDGSAQFAGGNLDVYNTGKVIYGADKITLDGTNGSAEFAGGDVNIDSSGNLGIGTSSPGSKLQVISTSVQGQLRFGYSTSVYTDCWMGTGFTVFDSIGGTSGSFDFRDDGTSRIRIDSSGNVKVIGTGTVADPKISLNANGSAEFAGDVIVGSRNKQWMIIESGGLAHLVEQTRSNEISTADLLRATEYPQLRDIPGELTMVEQQLQKVLEKLRMVPEAGWEIWDGSD